MAPSPGFFRGFKKALLILIAVGIVAAVLFFTLMPNNLGKLFGMGSLVLVLNLVLMYVFTRVNDDKRPSAKQREKEGRFDFHRDR